MSERGGAGTDRRPAVESAGAAPQLLSHCRVLDLTYAHGHLAGRLLGDLGADVVKIEPPIGDPARHVEPFYHDTPGIENSLEWWAFNYNKRGVTLALDTPGGRELLTRLVGLSDVLIESFPPGYLPSLGLGYQDLRALNPALIMTSITPFGREGPYRDFAASDLVLMGMGGYLFGCGDPDRPPASFPVEQAFHLGAAEGVVGTLIAFYARHDVGSGQHVDVSCQQCVQGVGGGNPARWLRTGQVQKRPGQLQAAIHPTVALRIIYPCRDGFVAFRLRGGPTGIAVNRALVEWMREDGMAEPWLDEICDDAWPFGAWGDDEIRRTEAAFARFFATHTKQELYGGAVGRRVHLYAVSSFQDISESPQLAAREYWRQIESHESGEAFPFPGPFARFSETPLEVQRRAPRLGEHNADVYGGLLGASAEDLSQWRAAGVI
jgi:crotonobetainyl-CoA:carnitine CoA-transferase CaiB-like acyl-CoA transferase